MADLLVASPKWAWVGGAISGSFPQGVTVAGGPASRLIDVIIDIDRPDFVSRQKSLRDGSFRVPGLQSGNYTLIGREARNNPVFNDVVRSRITPVKET